MSLKVFCDSCHGFIKVAKQDEVSELKGPVVCSACLAKSSTYMKSVEKIASEAINRINGVVDKARAAFDDARHSLVEPDA